MWRKLTLLGALKKASQKIRTKWLASIERQYRLSSPVSRITYTVLRRPKLHQLKPAKEAKKYKMRLHKGDILNIVMKEPRQLAEDKPAEKGTQ
jgi:hypothetical protein